MLTVPLIFAIGSAVVLLLALYHVAIVFSFAAGRRNVAERFVSATQGWENSLRSAGESLAGCSRLVGEARERLVRARERERVSSVPPPAADPEVARFRERVDELLGACERWSRRAGTIPPEIANLVPQAKTLRAEAVGGFDANRSDARFWQLAEAIARTALNYSEDHADPGRANAAIQEALDGLLAVAALETILPRRGDSVQRSMHTEAGSEPAPSEQWRGLIASVPRRGLIKNGNVLKPAEIRVYD